MLIDADYANAIVISAKSGIRTRIWILPVASTNHSVTLQTERSVHVAEYVVDGPWDEMEDEEQEIIEEAPGVENGENQSTVMGMDDEQIIVYT